MKMVRPSHMPGSAKMRYQRDAPVEKDAMSGGELRVAYRQHMRMREMSTREHVLTW